VRINNAVIVVLAILMGGVAAFLARGWLATHRAAAAGGPVGTLVVAQKPLGFGAPVTAENVIEISWATTSMPEGAFATKEALLKDGIRVVLAPLERGEPILRSKVTNPGQRASLSALLREGHRAVTVRVDDVRGVAGFILPGDFVDIVLIAEESTSKRENYSEVLLQHLKVLAVDQLAAERPEQPTVPKAVTLEVTTEQAQKILLAANVGKLSLALRKPADQDTDAVHRVTERDLGRSELRAPEPVRVAPTPPVIAPPPPPSSTVKVVIVRNMKQEEYVVHRVGD
jgi:pilus assembly protein CpaB